MPNIVIYTRPQCHFCQKLKDYLDSKKFNYEEVNLQDNPELQSEMEVKTNGVGSVPQLFVGDEYIGDCFEVLSDAGQEKLTKALTG